MDSKHLNETGKHKSPPLKKSVVLGVTGGIAAYKTIDLASTLTKNGIDVHVVLTNDARKFITPLTMEVITGHPVWTDENCLDLSPIPHIHLAETADLIVVAPASANTVAKGASGLGDNLLTSTLLAATSPVLYVPAMNDKMYGHPSTVRNLHTLAQSGCTVMEPDSGKLACGTTGKGRYPDNSRILGEIEYLLFGEGALRGLKVLITAGGTRESLDPVRYIGNRSSGKMGAALAREAKARGAEVTLVMAAHQLDQIPDVDHLVNVESAEDMYLEVMAIAEDQDIIIKAAAVADYTPVNPSEQKIKKDSGRLNVTLERTRDILKDLVDRKREQIIVGFAAETEHLEENALAKLKSKGLDLIVANDVSREDSGFGTDTNKATLYFADGRSVDCDLMGKEDLAREIIAQVIRHPRFGNLAR